ncbi:DUF6752 domain-containing protein [Leucobacter luti]|uniref:DUF6752 domain-containing protein n=1 Tax=Leucobacter luti TaxID=340320 RepID=A0A4R6RSQ7_9MICO|nr:DUF6752 domain-containing protein [Leucobacter luti]QYM76983.1 hypothetical protein K1X41_06325 [Leucobacter luti]TDP89860.1 hypothetical protein EDF62_3158 [Leucobacter luti]
MKEPHATASPLTRLRNRLSGAHIRSLQAELQTERERITQLEAELDELRRDSLRVAELVDLVEQQLSP